MRLLPLLILALLPFAPTFAEDEATRLAELDTYWATVAKAVGTGDFALYQSTCHPDGVLVSGSKKQAYPLSQALARWKKEFDATADGSRKSGLELRFSERWGDATTAHETGMFLYTATTADGKDVREFVHLEALLLKVDGQWKIMMEYQKSAGTEAEWDALKK